MPNWIDSLYEAIREAVANGGGMIVVSNDSRQMLATSALFRMATPEVAERVVITVDPNAEISRYETVLP
ncbi:MAG TPA: hypothetical protein VGR71_16750 [Nitrospira sp.]|nr:hypothetical protein [Nitrospira sp.]